MWILICNTGVCSAEPLMITREAMAIASCESGDGHNYGTFTVSARSHTADGGIWQFNDKTYLFIAGRTHADVDDPAVQYKMFKRLWNEGRGWKHWKASQKCWSQWLTIDEDGKAVWK
jgi:hypothetical protein